MASLTLWTWVWVNSGSWWWTRRPGVLRFLGSQRVRHDWATELNWTELKLTGGWNNEYNQIPKSFPGGSAGRESACNMGDLSSVPGVVRALGEGNSYPLQYSGLENSMDCISMGSQRVGHNWATFISLQIKVNVIITLGLRKSFLFNINTKSQMKCLNYPIEFSQLY